MLMEDQPRYGYINTKYFDRQLIFSHDISKFDERMRTMIKRGIGRLDPVSGKAYFYITKEDPDYHDILLKIRTYDFKVKERGNIIWYNVKIPSFSDERFTSKLTGDTFAKMNYVSIYPFTVYNGSKIFIVVQYKNDSAQEVTERALSNLFTYDEVFGQGAYEIEEISKPKEIPDVIRKLGIDSELYGISIEFGRKQKKLDNDFNEAKPAIKWPIMENGKVRLGTFEEVLTYTELPELSAEIFHSNFIRNVISSIYYEVLIEEKKITYKIIIEKELVRNVMNVLSMVMKEGGRFRITELNLL